ncbi:hypothetical protein D082_14200 [Synechocystis sp. PCC 6714]|nr:hypothetical protein D082_14200 [Synechocystis sp. PCC 6714]
MNHSLDLSDNSLCPSVGSMGQMGSHSLTKYTNFARFNWQG